MSRLIDSITVPNNLMFGLNVEWVKIFTATVYWTLTVQHEMHKMNDYTKKMWKKDSLFMKLPTQVEETKGI